jgi:hypothetical protein
MMRSLLCQVKNTDPAMLIIPQCLLLQFDRDIAR